MKTEKTRKMSKEQLVSYLNKHGSTLTEAAQICGVSAKTLGRRLAAGEIPSDWYAAITSALKDRKPKVKPVKDNSPVCAACGKKIPEALNKYNLDVNLLQDMGVKDIPTSGWHWFANKMSDKKVKMYPVCEKCWLKSRPTVRKKAVKAKIATKKD